MLKRILLWKYLIAVGTILGFCVYITQQDQKTRDQYEQKCSQLNAGAMPPSGHYEDCDKGAENAAGHLPRWYRIFGWPEGITTWAILLTLLALAEQTSQTKVAAQAALLNIQAFINSERPWIQVVAEESKIFGQSHWEIKAVNKGRTPAVIVSESIDYKIIGAVEFLDLPPRHSAQKAHREPKILLPDQMCELRTVTKKEFGLVAGSEQSKQFDTLEFEGFAYGILFYRDVLGARDAIPYETHWCFECLPWGKEGEEVGITLMESTLNEAYTKHT